MINLSSRSNEIIKSSVAIKHKNDAVILGFCLVESEKIINELLDKSVNISTVLVSVDKLEKYAYITNKCHGPVYSITPEIATYIADSKTTSGIFAWVEIPHNQTQVIGSNFLVLDNIQDPSNIGACIRSAKAFGFDTIVIIGGAYPYSFKCIRSSMGYVFDVNIIETDLSGLKMLLKENDVTLFSANMNGEPLDSVHLPANHIGLVIGNEGNGVDPEITKICNKVVQIPMQQGVESLNASVSAGIILYTIHNKEKK